MDVHDTPDMPRSLPLQPGMVITVEPGKEEGAVAASSPLGHITVSGGKVNTMVRVKIDRAGVCFKYWYCFCNENRSHSSISTIFTSKLSNYSWDTSFIALFESTLYPCI